MNRTDLENEIENYLEGLDIHKQFNIYSTYCNNAEYYDEQPFSTFDIDDICSSMTPTEILDKFEGWSSNWEYVVFNVYGYVEEWEGIEYYDEITNYIIDNNDDLDNDYIRSLLG